LWDAYVNGLRLFEEGFIGRVPRTLQLSNIFSQFETAARQTRVFTPEHLAQWKPWDIAHLENLTGASSYDFFREGLTFRNNKLFLSQSGKELLSHASIIRNVNKSHHFSTSYARSLGEKISGHAFSEALPFLDHTGNEVREIFQIIGGKTKGEHLKRQLFGYGTELVERVNRLARQSNDLPLVGRLTKAVFGRAGMGVRSGSGLSTFARLTGKLGLLGGAAVLGYETADWAVRRSSIFDHTIFNQGITAGAATIWAKLNLGYAKIGDITGWRKSAEEQEKYAPGSTSLLHLAAFPLTGAFTAGLIHYGNRLKLTQKILARRKAATIEYASETAIKILQKWPKNTIYSTLGKKLRNSRFAPIRWLAKTPAHLGITASAAITGLFALPYLFNALAPSHSEDELHDIYTGKKEIAVRKSRWWTFGRSPYEGEQIQYYKQHWYPMLMARSREKAIWGPLEGNDEFSPLKKFYVKNFTYQLEQAHMQDRPYPVSGRAFYDIPIIGPLLSATLGPIFKPERYMHTSSYFNPRSGSYKPEALPYGQDFNDQMGQLPSGNPISPHGLKGTIGEQFYRLTELTGLPGFLFNTVKNKLTGSQDLFDKETYLESADQIDSASRAYWDENMGDWGGNNELFRRLLPHKRNQIDTYNPIRNDMPDWLPGEGQRGPDLLHGDPYAKLTLGESRLPGEGYAALHPELKGLDPKDYPLIYKYKILADVAPFSDSFGDVEQQAALAFKNKKFSKEELEMYHEVQDQIKSKRNKKTFYEYKYRDKKLDPVQQALANWNEEQKAPAEKPSLFHRMLGWMWEKGAHNLEQPEEYITPLSPASKFLHMRTALEDYKKDQVYGTQSGFWDRPWANFIRPALQSSEEYFGKGIPGNVRDKRKLEEYFDILKYVKYTRLKDMAQSINDREATGEFEQKRRETLFGVNPYTHNYTQIFRALPRRDRDYFNDFIDNKDLNERKEILEMIPENEKGLFMAKWKQKDATDFAKAVKLGLLSKDEISKGEAQVKQMYQDMETEGLPKDDQLWQEFLKTRSQGESYADWYRRAKLLPEKASELGFNIPGPDWVGWNPAVELDDIKLKVVDNLGESIQDYDLWPQQEKALLYKQAFINDETVAPVQQKNKSSESDIRNMIQKILTEFNIHEAQVSVSMTGGNNNHVNMDIQDDRTVELRERLRAYN
jgi:hypothetical protein